MWWEKNEALPRNWHTVVNLPNQHTHSHRHIVTWKLKPNTDTVFEHNKPFSWHHHESSPILRPISTVNLPLPTPLNPSPPSISPFPQNDIVTSAFALLKTTHHTPLNCKPAQTASFPKIQSLFRGLCLLISYIPLFPMVHVFVLLIRYFLSSCIACKTFLTLLKLILMIEFYIFVLWFHIVEYFSGGSRCLQWICCTKGLP